MKMNYRVISTITGEVLTEGSTSRHMQQHVIDRWKDDANVSLEWRVEMPKDFHGTEIKAGDIIAVAMSRGRSACLEQRFVREVVSDEYGFHLEVQPEHEPPTDKRQLGRITNFKNCIIIS